jgi:DNA-directed RNA polymerase beta subunit
MANATSEYADVGLINHHTLNTVLSNKYGSYGGKDITQLRGFDLVALDEGLVPFINGIDPDRAVLAYTHRGQVTPIIDGEVPIVSTGGEYLISQLTSDKFAHRSDEAGQVLEVEPNNYIKVKYQNGQTKFLDISPRLSTTKRASYINLNMKTLQKGDKFEKNQLIAWTNNFDGEGYTGGKNTTFAVMNYLGYSYEDGYAISKEMSDNYKVEAVQEVVAMIPLDTKITDIKTQLGQDTQIGDTLVEFEYIDGDLEDYISNYNLFEYDSDTDSSENQNEDNLTDGEEDLESLYKFKNSKIKITSPGGEISQIKVFLNNMKSVDPSVIKLWKEITNTIKDRKKKYTTGNVTEQEKLRSIDNLDMSQLKTGKHKYKGILFEGARIVFYIKQTKTLQTGDKLANRLNISRFTL